MQKLDRLVWAEGACFESYGVRVGIRTSQIGAVERLITYLPPEWRTIEPPRRLDALYSWVVGGERRPGVRAFDIMYADAGRIARTLKLEELFDVFEANLRLTLATLSRKFVFIHAGAVSWRGRAILLPGRTFTGKSTFVEALVRAGAEYFSDEYALLDRKGYVHAFAKPISVRMPNTPGQQPRTIEEVGGTIAEHPAKVAAIVVTRYREGAESRFRRASIGRGILDLMANAIAVRTAPSRVFSAVRDASANAVVLRGPRGEAQEAAERLFAILDKPQYVTEKTKVGDRNGVTGKSAMAAEG